MWFLFVSKYNVTFSDLLNVKHLKVIKRILQSLTLI